jgi:hypothetical protein
MGQSAAVALRPAVGSRALIGTEGAKAGRGSRGFSGVFFPSRFSEERPMGYPNMSRLFAAIIKAVNQVGDIRPRMHSVIAECNAQRPHADWQIFRDLDYGADAERLRHWLSDVYRDEAAPLFKGLWVGLVQLIRDGETVADARDLFRLGSSRRSGLARIPELSYPS